MPFHDARALLGRTYGWQRRFDEARPILEDLVRRAPGYVDGYVALIDITIWANHGDSALTLADQTVTKFPRSAPLLVARARALELVGRKAEALAALDAARAIDPANAEGATVRARLSK